MSFVFWHSWNCAPQIHSTDTRICVDFYNKMCGKKNLRNGITETGSTIITLPHHTLCLCKNFWPITAWLSSCTLWTLWMWHPHSFSFSQNETGAGGHRFHDISMIQDMQATFSEFWTQNVLKFFKKWHSHSAYWIHFQGDYFKRDRMD